MAFGLLIVGQGQTQLIISGQLLQGENPVFGKQITWVANGETHTNATDSMGQFQLVDTFFTQAGQGDLYWLNCQADTQWKSITYVNEVATVWNLPLQYCDTTSQITQTLQGRVQVTDTSSFAPRIAQVWLLQHDSTLNYLLPKDSVFSLDGAFHFEGLETGTYLIRGGLIEQGQEGDAFMPTYFGGGLFWQEATSTILNQHTLLPPIPLVPVQPQLGTGSIEGRVNYHDLLEGVANATVLLLNELGEPVAYTRSGKSGEYLLNNLAPGSYQVFVEIPGKIAIGYGLTLTNQNLNQAEVDFVVDLFQTQISPSATSLDSFSQVGLRIFPNPTQGNLILEWDKPVVLPTTVSLFELGGKQVFSQSIQSKMNQTIDLGQLPKGFYSLRIVGPQETWTTKLLKN